MTTTLSQEHWKRHDQDGEGFEVVSLVCPDCGKSSTLWCPVGGHAIAADGTVHPSVVCPFEPRTFHRWVRLEGWTHGARARIERSVHSPQEG